MKESIFAWAVLIISGWMVGGASDLHAGVTEYGYDAAGRLVQLDNREDVFRVYYQHDDLGNITSRTTVQVPVITSGPLDTEVEEGETALFSVTVTGGGRIGYEWQKDGSMLAGGNLATLTLANSQKQDAGNYRVLVSNELGSVQSGSAQLTVSDATELQLVSPFQNATYLGNRTYETWMGQAYLPFGETREFYLQEQGWISVGPALSGGLWYWDYAMQEWVYTNPVFYPNIYLPSLQWLLYWDPFCNADTRWFYRYGDADYYSWPRYPGPLPFVP